MNEYRAKPADLCMADAMPFQRHYEYRTTYPVKDLLHEKFLRPVAPSLRAADQITLCRYEGQRWEELREIATLRIVKVQQDAITFHIVGEVAVIPHDAPEVINHTPVLPDGEQFIKADGSTRWNVGRQRYDVMVDDVVVASTKDKQLAKEIARGNEPLNKAV